MEKKEKKGGKKATTELKTIQHGLKIEYGTLMMKKSTKGNRQENCWIWKVHFRNNKSSTQKTHFLNN